MFANEHGDASKMFSAGGPLSKGEYFGVGQIPWHAILVVYSQPQPSKKAVGWLFSFAKATRREKHPEKRTAASVQLDLPLCLGLF